MSWEAYVFLFTSYYFKQWCSWKLRICFELWASSLTDGLSYYSILNKTF